MSTPAAPPRSLVWATDIQVLPSTRLLERRERYLVVRSPDNPSHHWGNFLLFDEPPAIGDGGRWEQHFRAEFSGPPGVAHVAFGWDRPDGGLGEAGSEFVARGYELEQIAGLRAAAGRVRAHPRENREITIVTLDPRPGADPDLWAQVVELWVGLLAAGARTGAGAARLQPAAPRRAEGALRVRAWGPGMWPCSPTGGR